MQNEDLELALSICAMQRALSRALNHIGDSYKVGWTEFCLLKAVRENPGIGIQKLASEVSLSSGSATYTIDKLESLGLLTRSKRASDSRYNLVLLTESGEKLQTELSEALRAVSSKLFQGIIIEKKSCALDVIQEAIVKARTVEYGEPKRRNGNKRG